MTPTQKRVFNLLASAQEPIKVELGLIDNLDKAFSSAAQKAQDQKRSILAESSRLGDISFSMEQSVSEAKKALSAAQELGADGAIKTLSSFISVFEKKASQFKSIASQIDKLANSITK